MTNIFPVELNFRYFLGHGYFGFDGPGNFVLNTFKATVINAHPSRMSIGHALATGSRKEMVESARAWQNITTAQSDLRLNVFEVCLEEMQVRFCGYCVLFCSKISHTRFCDSPTLTCSRRTRVVSCCPSCRHSSRKRTTSNKWRQLFWPLLTQCVKVVQ